MAVSLLTLDDVLDLAEAPLFAGYGKEAWTIGNLVAKTRNKKTHQRAKRCRVRMYRFERSRYRWMFRVSCSESYSAPYHVTRFRVDVSPEEYRRFTSRSTVLVSCSCPAWLYWGSAYRATQKQYNDGRKEGRPPNIRDPQGLNFLCKHVVAATPFFTGYTVPIPKELAEKRDVPEVEVDL